MSLFDQLIKMTDRCFWCFGLPAPVERQSRTTQTMLAPPQRSRTRPSYQSVRAGPSHETTPLKGILKKTARVRTRRPYGYQLLLHQDPEDKRAAFMELLANRYPAYADRIYSGTGTQSEIAYPIKQSRTRDPRRRQTTIVTYHPNTSLEYDDSGTMSDLDAPTNSFNRGGFQRSSMPIVRTASSTLDRTLGLAFLVFGSETKKCLLPNEITTLDTVRALFVHHFPEKLTFEYLEQPRQKIYILDPKTNIFFQLDDIHEIRDRTVLRIHECDSGKPQKLKEQPKVRGRAISAPPEHHYRPGHAATMPSRRDDGPLQPYHTYMIDGDTRGQWEEDRRSRSRSRTPDPERPKSLPSRSRYSPDRHSTPERGLLGTIPEHHQLRNGRPPVQNGAGGQYEAIYYQRPQSQPTSPTRTSRPFSPTNSSYENPYYGYHAPPPSSYYPQHNGGQSAFVAKNKRPPANLPGQYAMIPPQQPDTRNGNRHTTANRHSLAFAPMTTCRPPQENYYQAPARHRPPASEDDSFSQSRSATPVPEYYHSKKRIDKMEVQLASLAAWVHKSATDSLGRVSSRSNSSNASESTETLPVSSSSKNVRLRFDYSGLSGLSDSGSSQRTIVTCSREMKLSMVSIREKTCNLRIELRGLRRAQQVNYEDICETIATTLYRIKKVLLSTPGANCQLIRQQRYETDGQHYSYMSDKQRLEKELSDLEQSVEELRNDVVTRQCRVQMVDIESMALLLSNITKSIADLKTRFPCLQEQLKSVMEGEMQVVVTEEKFLKEEPDRIDSSLKRCKKLTGTLYTLKRLASVQDHRPLNVPSVASKTCEPSNEDKHGVLENIRAIVPNHTTRLNSLEEAETSRERKKKLIQQKDALKFGKSLELASKSLKSVEDKMKSKPYAIIVSSNNNLINTVKPVISSPAPSHGISVTSKVLPIQPQTTSSVLTPHQATLPTSTQPLNQPELVTSATPLSSMAIPASPTATQDVLELNNQKLAARAAFFSSMSSPETSPNSPSSGQSPAATTKLTDASSSPVRTTMDYVVKFSPAQISSIKSNSLSMTTSSTGTVLSTGTSEALPNYYTQNVFTTKSPTYSSAKEQLSPTSKQGSNIPRPSQDSLHTKYEGEGPMKGKKPPPPPPRKSSRLPLGAHVINGTVSPVRAFSPENIPTDTKVISPHPVVYSSTPKPPAAKKPVSKYQKDLISGIYANMNRPDLQCQKSPPESEQMPSKAEMRTNVLSDREGSSDSTSSSASLDSQIGAAVLRDKDMTGSNGSLSKKKKPKPPERRSSLLSNSPTRTSSDTRTQLLQDQTVLLKELEQQQTTLMQQHNNLVRSQTSPPPTLPKPTSPVSKPTSPVSKPTSPVSKPTSPVSQNGKK